MKNPVFSFFIFITWVVVALLVSQFLALLILYPFYGEFILTIQSKSISGPEMHPELWSIFMFLQGFSSFCGLIVAPIGYLMFFKSDFEKSRYQTKNLALYFGLGILLTLAFMPVNAVLADMNASMELPSFMSGIEQWVKAKEDELALLTEFLTRFETNTQFLFGLLVIAIIPAIGEELVFRGFIQRMLIQSTGKKYLSIFITGILFSAIHLQFYGFIPRAALGIVFGFLYYWSGVLWVPIACHFVNNAVTLLLIHLNNLGYIHVDLESSAFLPAPLILISMGLVIGILFFLAFRKRHRTSNT